MGPSSDTAGAPPSTVVVAATRAEQPGASMRVAGLTIVERAIKQLAQAPDTKVIVASDGSVPLPAALPANAEVRTAADAAGVAALADGLGAPVVGADVVRVARGDAGTRVTDEPGRRAVE